jgi:phosphoenolpyruvate synthase/pyruvate phosphate dikinase
LPIPPGFSVTTRAYCDYVSNGPTAAIAVALGGLDFTDRAAADAAAEQIVRAFNRFPVPERSPLPSVRSIPHWTVRSQYVRLRPPETCRMRRLPVNTTLS